MPSLRADIKASLVPKNKKNNWFLPEGRLKELICKTAVETALEQHRAELKTEISELATFVCSGARRIFAILIWGDREKLIEGFYKNNFKDNLLPVKLNVDDDGNWTVESLANGSMNSKVVNATFKQRPWTEASVDDFCDSHQWLFLAPVFREEVWQYVFYSGCRMPFLNVSDGKETNYSVVEGCNIHPDHLKTRKKTVICDLLLQDPSHILLKCLSKKES
jgi:hypothetical protein